MDCVCPRLLRVLLGGWAPAANCASAADKLTRTTLNAVATAATRLSVPAA